MDEELALQELNNGKIIKTKDCYNKEEIFIKNFKDNQICRIWYANLTHKNIAVRAVYGTSFSELQEEIFKNAISYNSKNTTTYTFREYFNSLPLKRSKDFNYEEFIIRYFNDCEELSSTHFKQSTLYDSINDILNNKVAVLNLDSKVAFLIYHNRYKKVYFVYFDNVFQSLYAKVIFDQKDIATDDITVHSYKSAKIFETVDKKILSIYDSFEQFFSQTILFRYLYSPKPDFYSEVKKDLAEYPNRKEWEEFRDSGVLQSINDIIKTIGWEIDWEEDSRSHKILNIYPKRL